MKESTSKEKVLKKVRNALINKSKDAYADVDFESPIHAKSEDTVEIDFAEKFTSLEGKFAFCVDEDECIGIIQDLLSGTEMGKPFCLDQKIKEMLTKAGIAYSDQPDDVSQYKVSISLCEYLVARTGSVMVSSRQESGRRSVVFPDVHVVVAYTSQLVEDVKDALKLLRDKHINKLPSQISLITGPSRTADIEKTLVLGAHGPKEIYVFLIDDTQY
jgi:L-lactate dehydrogenase complex protein LldG